MSEQINVAAIGLGSNIHPKKNINKARAALANEYNVIMESGFVKTKPVGLTQQPDFINGAILVSTNKDLIKLKEDLRALEQKLGRKPSKIKFGPRSIDLDIITYNGKVIDQDFYERDFIKESTLQLIPNLRY